MKDYIEERAVEIAYYIIEQKRRYGSIWEVALLLFKGNRL